MATELKRMQQRRDTAANWSADNPVLLPGELGLDTDAELFKVGDGVSAWDDLDFKGDFAAAEALIVAGIADTGSPIETALSASYARTTSAVVHAPAFGLFFPEVEGAIGDGTTNDTTALADTIAAASAAGGGKVIGLAGAVYGASTTLALLSGVTLEGLHLKDITGNVTIVSLADCVDGTVEHCTFTGSGTLGTAGRGAIWGAVGSTSGPTRCKVLNNTINVVGTSGITLADAVGCVVSGNVVCRTVEHGIYISTASEDCVIEGNIILEAGYGGVSTCEGIKIAGTAANISVQGNVIVGALADGILFESGVTDSSAKDNLVRECGGIGIRVNAGASDIEIVDNTVLDNVGVGIRCLGGTTVKISDNKVRANGVACIQTASGTTGVSVTDNHITQLGGNYSIDLTVTGAHVSGNVAKPTGADAGFIIRATSTLVTVPADNKQPAGITNSAGSGAVIQGSMADVVAATTPGSVTFKMTAYDAGGNTVGYIPIYGTIT